MAAPVYVEGLALPRLRVYHGGMARRRLNAETELGFRDAAKFLDIPESTFARLARNGEIPRHYKPLAKRPYYLVSELQAIKDRKHGNGTTQG